MKQADLNKKKVMNLLSKAYNLRENVIKISKHSSEAHELAKAIVSIELIRNGDTILTEAIFKDLQRADIISLSTATIYEILHSETLLQFEHNKNYPLQTVTLQADDVIAKMVNRWTNNKLN